MRDDEGSDKRGGCGGREKGPDSTYMLKVEPREFQHELDMGERKDLRMTPRFLA